jgi:hypothetical protein
LLWKGNDIMPQRFLVKERCRWKLYCDERERKGIGVFLRLSDFDFGILKMHEKYWKDAEIKAY